MKIIRLNGVKYRRTENRDMPEVRGKDALEGKYAAVRLKRRLLSFMVQ
jgi:hypothetical protein